MRDVWQNLGGAFAYNSAGLPIALGALYPFFGILLSPLLAAAAMSFSSTVITNANRLKHWKPREVPCAMIIQQIIVTVAGLAAIAGKPVRLTFRREETTPCSQTVVFDAFGKHADLPEGQLVPVELMPGKPGEYPFTCGMGMLRGTLIVT